MRIFVAKKIMLQGTGSSVGKSIVVTAFCRILNDQNQKVAPFKSQNMALNAYVTEDGLEMGRAQVAQAEAARIKPTVAMNPILLKPTSDSGSQVILNGKVLKNIKAKEYFSEKNKMIPEVMKAFRKLESDYDYIVIEGAGSPAEINLRHRDIVNMGLAELVDTDVILVGDVDRGGVFASIYGTFALLSESEQKRLKGFIINKFRGDESLLTPGIKMLEEKINRPCLGVLPYVEKINIDDEDSVTERFNQKSHLNEGVKMGVIKLPYLSNLSDFTCFDMYDDVEVLYIKDPQDLETCDLIILPGSKNTLFDMKYLHDSGLAAAIIRYSRLNKPIIGICGGYQMLGLSIEDPHAVESQISSINGLGLLALSTQMSQEKTTQQSKGITIQKTWLSEESLPVEGYEIHMGQTEALDGSCKPWIKLGQEKWDGHVHEKGMIMGTYLHGIFDNDLLRAQLIHALKQNKKIASSNEALTYIDFKEQAYDNLANLFSKHLNWDVIEEIFNESRPTPCTP